MARPSLHHHLSSIIEQRIDQLATALREVRRTAEVDAVHDLRVASRRLRAFGVTFRDLLPEKTQRRLEKRLKPVARAVGALRDLDVHVELLEERLAETPNEVERAALEHLLELLSMRRVDVARRAQRRLGKLEVGELSRPVRRALDAVTQGLAERGQEAYALAVLETLVGDAAVHSPADGSEAAEDPERLHRLRIDIKELRYCLELFEPVLGPSFPELYARGVALQEVLGAYHDLVTLADVIGERSTDLRGRQRHAIARGLEGVAEALATEQKAVLGSFLEQGFDADGWRDALKRALSSG
jgi:CHAD domain-containing protein